MAEAERPAFEARLSDGSWLRVYASGRLEGVEHDVIVNRIQAIINHAVACATLGPAVGNADTASAIDPQ